MKKLITIGLASLGLSLATPSLAADVSADIGTNTGVQTGPTAGTVGGTPGVHSSTATGTTGVNTTTGSEVNAGMEGTAAVETDTDVNAPANTMARITQSLSAKGYTNVQRFNDANASSKNNLAFTAKNKDGKDMLVTVDSQTGTIISETPHK